jgi:hypothetical protein
MRHRTTKHLINLASLALLGTASAVGYWGITPVSGLEVDARARDSGSTSLPASNHGEKAKAQSSAPAQAAAAIGCASQSIDWGRALRRPLFDPPPPPPVVVAHAPPPPLRAKLLATVIESENSTAMLRLASGQVVFRRVGESLGADEAGAEVSKIETGAILVRRGKEELRLSVEGTSGK